MVSTRGRGAEQPGQAQASKKRSAPSASSTKPKSPSKKTKTAKDGKLELGDDGELGLKQEEHDDERKKSGHAAEAEEKNGSNEKINKDGEVEQDRGDGQKDTATDDNEPIASENEGEEQDVMRSGRGATKQEVRSSEEEEKDALRISVGR